MRVVGVEGDGGSAEAAAGAGAGAHSAGSRSALAQLAAVLVAANPEAEPTPREIAELLWFARRLGDVEEVESGARRRPRTDLAADAPRLPTPVADTAVPPRSEPPTHPRPPATAPDERVPLHLPDPPRPDRAGRPLFAPAPPMLPHPLALQRALRPLKRRVAVGPASVLDERGTADRIARLGAHPDVWLPVLCPAPERWLRLNLVHDTGPTMPVWRPLVRELHTVLAQSGVFRTVTLHPATPDGRARRVPDVADGRTVTLVVSDCTGPQWRPGPAGERWYRTLRRWAAHLPLAVVQPLPERLWHTTALPAEPGLLTAPAAAAPTTALGFVPYDPDGIRSGLPLPVLEAGPSWLAHWAALIGSPGGARVPGAAARLASVPPPPGEPAAADIASLPPQDLVLHFRASSSPEAFRLAGHLALSVPSLPVMRLVHRALETAPRPQHLAEIILSGLLTTVPGPPGSYAFRPGVRELLLRSLPRTARARTRELLARVGGLIDERAGIAAAEFRAETTGEGPAFATVSEETVRRLGGAAAEGAGGPVAEGAADPAAAGTAGPAAEGTAGPGAEGTADPATEGTTSPAPAGTADPATEDTTGPVTEGTAGPVAAETTNPASAGPAPVVSRRSGAAARGADLLAGRYRPVRPRGPGQRVWEAVDERTDRTVVVHLYPEGAVPRERFLREARVLAELRHPNVVPVLDFGFDGQKPYLVGEFMDGVTLTELLVGSGPVIPLGVLSRLAVQGVAGLEALHARGLLRGQPRGDGWLLRPDGTVVISRVAVGEQPPGAGPADDFRELDRLLLELAPDVEAPLGFRTLLRELAEQDRPERARYAAAEFASVSVPRRMRVRMLGPLRLTHGSEPQVGQYREAPGLLCMLVLRSGRRVSRAELVRGIWDQAPSDAETRLSTVASVLRRHLPGGSLIDLGDGYALHAPDDYVDVVHCERLLAERTPDQHPRDRRALVQQALDLFYGTPLDDVPGPAARSTREHLLALRLNLWISRAELDLELGDFEKATVELAALLQDRPGQEDLRRLHLLALRGQGRISEAVDSYETFLEHWERQYNDPVPEALQDLYRDLVEKPARGRPTVVFEVPGLDDDTRAHDALGRAVTRLLSAGGLAADQFEVLARDHGYVVLTEGSAEILPVLTATLRDLPVLLGELPDPPRFRVTFWHAPWFAAPDRDVVPDSVHRATRTTEADILVVVSPPLYEELASTHGRHLSSRFEPLTGDGESRPLAWYQPLTLAAPAPGPERLDLVRGPFTTPDVLALTNPDPGRTAVVHTRADGPLTLLNPDQPYGTRPPRSTTYYEVDLTTQQAGHEVSLPSSGGGAFAASVELSWHVSDPVAYVQGRATGVAELLLEHLLKEAARITRRHPLRRAGAAQHAVHEGVRRWPVAGLSVTCAVRLAPQTEGSLRRGPSASGRLAELLAGAHTVLIGFDGVLTELFSAEAAREAAADLLSLFPEQERPATPEHPLDVVRAFRGRGLDTALRERLDALELRAAGTAPFHRDAVDLLRALRESRRSFAVVGDVGEPAIHRVLEWHGLPAIDVQGRTMDLGRLMPDPDCLRRALWRTGVMIGSSTPELDAAKELGLPFIGVTSIGVTAPRPLREADCDAVVTSLSPLLDAVRSL